MSDFQVRNWQVRKSTGREMHSSFIPCEESHQKSETTGDTLWSNTIDPNGL